MKYWLALLVMLPLALPEGRGAQVKAVVDVAPNLVELGEGWTTNLIFSLLDPLSRTTQAVPKTQSVGRAMTNQSGPAPQFKGQMGWGRFHYGRGDLIVNRGAYFVTIQRWGNTNALDKVWKGWKTRPDYSAWRGPAIGEGCYWMEEGKFQGLTFRRGLFHVVVTCGAQSDRAGLFRLAEVIDAKIEGHPIPKPDKEADAAEAGQKSPFQPK